MSDKSYIPGGFSVKVTPDIDFTDGPVVECDVPVVKIIGKSTADDSK